MAKIKTKKIHITLERTSNKLNLLIKLPKEIEDYFKGLSHESEPQTSSVWVDRESNGVKFYPLPDNYKQIEDRLSSFYLNCNNFGSGLIENDRINIAPLRAVGASDGIRIFSDKFNNLNLIDFEQYIRQLGQLTKMLWVDYIAEKKIKAVISFEL